LSDEACQILAKALHNKSTLECINLRGNAIDSFGAEALLILVRENRNISKINLDMNVLKSEIVSDIEQTCFKNKMTKEKN
jgi:hypothetical protein